jgi:hypothetical protein
MMEETVVASAGSSAWAWAGPLCTDCERGRVARGRVQPLTVQVVAERMKCRAS